MVNPRAILAAIAMAFGLSGCAEVSAEPQGQAIRTSWYGGSGERLNTHTANGDRFNPSDRTCAHRTLPFGTRIQVTFRGHSTICRVNDRGPAKWTGRDLDLTRSAADDIGIISMGVAPVSVRILDPN